MFLVVVEELREVVYPVEEGDPAVVVGVVPCHFVGRIESAKLVGPGQVFGLDFLVTARFRKVRRWDASCH